jgi:hypothetical protein
MILLFIAGLTFVVFGFLGAIRPEDFTSTIFKNLDVIRISGILGVCFFGVGIIFIGRKIFDNRPGLIVDQYGITNNTNATSMGFIEWDDIIRIEKKQVMSTRFLILHTDNPEKYINRAKNVISKKAMNMNYKTYGSPISITSNSLKINFDDLEKLIRSEFKAKKHLG